MTTKKLFALFTPVAIVIGLDQLTKWMIRTTPKLHRKEIIEGWLEFYYTQNDGMALGIDIFSTPVVSMISITATIAILGYLLYSIDRAPIGHLIFMGLVIGGALGNITDRLIMGFIEGYGGLLDGHVIDFIHFDLQINNWAVFPYIFNVADMAISVSIISLLTFNKKLMPHQEKAAQGNESELTTHENISSEEVE